MIPLKRGQLKSQKFQFTDFDKQLVYLGVFDPDESKSGLTFELGLLLHGHFGIFVKRFKNPEKLVGRIVSQIRPCIVLSLIGERAVCNCYRRLG